MSRPIARNRWARPIFAFGLAALAPLLAGALASPAPTITSLSSSALSRSARLIIQGSGFGADQGMSRVEISGFPAIVTRWSDDVIAAYVPESAPFGTGSVRVTSGGGESNAVALDVTPRAALGRVQWRFQVDSADVQQRPAVGPDGTIVAHDSNAFVYALTPDGGLKWVFRTDSSAYGPPAVGPDGSVYVAAFDRMYGLAPDGTLRWQFTDPDSQGAIAGPSLGPDGNLYVVDDLYGLGAFSLSTAGQLLWSHNGVPRFTEYGALGSEIVFGPSTAGGPPNQLYVALDEYGVAASTAYGLDLDGQQRWARPAGGSDDPFMQQQRQVAVGPEGNVYLTAFSSAIGWGLTALHPADGAVRWAYYPWPANGMSPPDVGPDGAIYLARSLDYLDALRPDGRLLWTVPFGGENGGNGILTSRPRFSPDDRTVYVATTLLGGSEIDPYCYLYAIKASDEAPVSGEAGSAGPMTADHGPGTSVEVAYAPACNANDHWIYWGAGPITDSVKWIDSACGLGTDAIASFDPGTPAVGTFFYFVIVGQGDRHEGSYGRSSAGVERPEATGVGICDRPQALALSCAP
jgi:outer membrane protein assembly factor BamB